MDAIKDLTFAVSKQKVFTADQLAKLEKQPLYSQDGKKGETIVIAKFFLGSYTWYITELDMSTGEAFGVTVNEYGAELGYVSIPELAKLTTHCKVVGDGLSESLPVGVERDVMFTPTKLADIEDPAVQELCRKLWDK